MLELKDGPCQGMYLCKRAPVFLRAVVDNSGEKEVLDLIDDTPQTTEKIYVYEREGMSGSVHIHAKGASGWYALGTYHYLSDIDGEKLRDNAAWIRWAEEHSREVKGHVA